MAEKENKLKDILSEDDVAKVKQAIDCAQIDATLLSDSRLKRIKLG